jgi:branched-chain amino acid transport system substrate-binding protein
MPRILLAGLLLSALATATWAQSFPGVTESEIKIGQTMPYTGPGMRLSAPGVAELAYMKMINERGGLDGRRINLISADDGYLPWRTGNETRKLVEVERVAFVFGSIGTTTQLAVANYLNEAKIPQLFIGSGAYRWGDYQATPYTVGGVRPTYRVGARAYTRHILRQNPNAKICILYEDDAFGRDYPAGVRDVLGDRYAATVQEATYGLLDKTIDPQITRLKASGCDAFIAGALPPFVTQAISKAYELAWKPMFFVANISTSVPTVLEPAGLEKSVGILSSAWAKDPSDPEWVDDTGMRDFKAWMSNTCPLRTSSGRTSFRATTMRPR